MRYVLSQSLKAADLVGIKHHCHRLTSTQYIEVHRYKKRRWWVPLLVCVQNTSVVSMLPPERSKWKQRGQRRGSAILEPTPMEDCRTYGANRKRNRSTLFVYQASWRNFSGNFTFHEPLCFNMEYTISFQPTNLQHIFAINSWTFMYLSCFVFFSLNNKDKSQIILQECQTSYLKIKSYPNVY